MSEQPPIDTGTALPAHTDDHAGHDADPVDIDVDTDTVGDGQLPNGADVTEDQPEPPD
ncbi:MAG: hypothetical protein ABJA34_12130 [Pseudonocardiales bacterium]